MILGHCDISFDINDSVPSECSRTLWLVNLMHTFAVAKSTQWVGPHAFFHSFLLHLGGLGQPGIITAQSVRANKQAVPTNHEAL